MILNGTKIVQYVKVKGHLIVIRKLETVIKGRDNFFLGKLRPEELLEL